METKELSTPAVWQQSGNLYQRTNVVVPRHNQSGGTWWGLYPTAINTYALTNGEFRGADLVVTNFHWLAGSVNRDTAGSSPVITVPSGGQLQLLSNGDHYLSTYVGASPGRLVNNGTGTWQNGRFLGNYSSRLENNGSLGVTDAGSFVWAGYGSGPILANAGSLAFGTNFGFSSAVLDNAGSASLAKGTLTFGSSYWTNRAPLSVDASAKLILNGSYAFWRGPLTAPTSDSIQLIGSEVSVETKELSTPAVWQQSGNLYQRTNVVVPRHNQSGGTWWGLYPTAINTYALTNGEFRGADLVVTNFHWLAGSVSRDTAGSSPVVTVPAGGQLNIVSGGDHYIGTYIAASPSRLVNNGTGIWQTGRVLGNYASSLENNGSLSVSGSPTFVYSGGGAAPVFLNSGTANFGTDVTFSTANATNSGTWNANAGTTTFASSSFAQTAGAFNLSGAAVDGSGSSAAFKGGILAGNGRFNLPVDNQGATIRPAVKAPGILQFATFVQGAGGTLDVDLGRGIPGTNSDLVRVTGTATVGGTLKMRLLPGVGVNDQYTVLTTSARSGTFATLQQPANGLLDATYSTTNVVLNLKELFEGSAPNIGIQPLDITTNQGAAVTFAATATGSEPIAFQWFFNDVALDGQTSSNLVLAAVARDTHAGNYFLVAANDFNSITSRVARLDIRIPAVIPAGNLAPVAQWHFDEPAASPVALDSSSNRYDGILSTKGSLFAGGGIAGRAVSFDRASGGLVNMGSVLPLTNTDFTVSFWMRANAGDNAGAAVPVARHATGTVNGYFVGLNSQPGYGAAHKAWLYASTPGSSGRDPRSTTDVDDGAWHQIAAVHRASGANDIYVDGAPVEASTASDPVVANTAAFLVGGVTTGGAPVAGFTGSVDELSVYGTALTTAQVDYLFRNPAAESVPPLVAPTIGQSPADAIVPAGSSANFSVGATGIEPFNYQWTFDGADIPGATGPTLQVPNATVYLPSRNLGRYAVRVGNAYGTNTSGAARLDVTGVLRGLAAYFPFDGDAREFVAARNGSPVLNVASNGFAVTGSSYLFNGVNAFVGSTNLLGSISDNFTVSFWAKPTAGRNATGEANAGIQGTSGQRYALGAAWEAAGDGGGVAAISVGTNGVSVFEHQANHLPSPLVLNTNIGDWTLVTVVYAAKTPTLYLNGTRVRSGLPSIRGTVHPGILFGDINGYGPYAGWLDEVRIWDRSLGDDEVASLFIPDIASPFLVASPGDTNTVAGSGVNLEVVATGSDPISYSWTQDDVAVAGAVSPVLPLPALVGLDDRLGDYQIRAVNRYGAVVSTNARVTVTPSTGEAGWITWEASGGKQPDSVDAAWQLSLNNQAVAPRFDFGAQHIATASNGDISGFSTFGRGYAFPQAAAIEFRLRMGPGSTSHDARGWAIVTFSLGGGYLGFLHFTDTEVWFNTGANSAGPKVTIANDDAYHLYRIDFDGRPGVRALTLSRDGIAVATGSTYASASGAVPGIDFGELSTLARGTSDWRSFRYTAAIDPNPKITRDPVGGTFPAGAIVTLDVQATGQAPLAYQWYRGGSPVTDATGSTLVATNIQPGQAGTYTVTVANVYSTATSQGAVVSVAPGVVPAPVTDPGVGGRLNSITFLNSLFGFVTGDNGQFRYTTDGGVTWLVSAPGVPNRITGAAFYGGAYWIVGSGGLICASYDGGLTWVPFNTGTTDDFNGIAFGPDGTGYAVGCCGRICIYRNGVWSPAQGIPGDVDFRGVYSYGDTVWAVGSNGTICVYRNGVWSSANTGGFGGSFYGVGFSNGSNGLAVGCCGRICISRNGGASWTPVGSGTGADLYAVSWATGDIAFYGGAGGVIGVTLDGGATWTPLASGTTDDITGFVWRDGIAYYVDASGRCRAFRFRNLVPNLPPVGRIVAPTNYSTYTTNVETLPGGILSTNIFETRHAFTNLACVPVNIVATATDPDGFVTLHELFANGVPLAAENDGFIRTKWTNCTPGSYWITGVVTDNRGAVAYSPPVQVGTIPPYHVLVPGVLPDGVLRLCYSGDQGRDYGVEFSNDLLGWTYLGPFIPTNSILQYFDGSITNLPYRMYRAVELPPKP